jgi:hypothetical protein
MMREVFYCDTCGSETGFVINGVPYCMDHAMEGIGVQARLVASLNGADSEAVRHMGEWAQAEVAAMFGLPDE